MNNTRAPIVLTVVGAVLAIGLALLVRHETNLVRTQARQTSVSTQAVLTNALQETSSNTVHAIRSEIANSITDSTKLLEVRLKSIEDDLERLTQKPQTVQAGASRGPDDFSGT